MIVTLLSVSMALAPAPLPDPWFGEDKLKHLFSSFVISSFAASGARAAGFDRPVRIGATVGIGAGTGVAKEVADYRARGQFSYRDLIWDMVGVAAAAVVANQTR
jgi:putative lipoprotein